MRTWKDIAKALSEAIPPSLIEPANQKAGIYGNWMRGHVVMQLANKIFGPDGWESYIISPPKVEERVVAVNSAGTDRMGVLVTCIVQITAHGLDDKGYEVTITKQDIGWGTAAQSWQGNQYQPLKPQQMRPALMGAITIGFKRCFHQFGRHLGMELYMPDEDVIALGWEEGTAPADATATQQRRPPVQRPKERPASPAPATTEPPQTSLDGSPAPPPPEPPFRQRPSAGDAAPVSTTVDMLAKELGIEATAKNQRVLVTLAATELKMKKAGATKIRTKKVKNTLETDEGGTVARVYAEMASYACWMAGEADKGGKVSKPFADMGIYMLLMRQTSDTRYALQGGTYEPWPGVGPSDPTTMVGFAIEKNAIKSLLGGMTDRFPEADEAAVTKYSTFHLRKHLEKHFMVERLGLLTWEQLAAFRLHVTESQAYPTQWSGGDEAAADENLIDFGPGPDKPTTESVDPVLTKKDVETFEAAVEEAFTQMPEGDEDYAEKCKALLIEIQDQMEYEGDLAAFAGKQGDLSLETALKAVEAIHKGVASGNINAISTLEIFLTTALKGLA